MNEPNKDESRALEIPLGLDLKLLRMQIGHVSDVLGKLKVACDEAQWSLQPDRVFESQYSPPTRQKENER